MSAGLFASYLSVARALEKVGVPSLSPYWRAHAERLYTHDTRAGVRFAVQCVGRGGDKSREIVREALTETLFGDFAVPRGERHYFAIVSENMTEATKTLRLIEEYLRILRIGFDRSGDVIELRKFPRGIRVLACRVGAVSGFRCFGWAADEAAKWSVDGSNPAAEVVASMRAMTVTHPGARGRLHSSPLARVGFFFDSWSRGDNEQQIVGRAATWDANESVTREQTIALEPDERTWRREYAAEFSDAVSSAFVAEHIEGAIRPVSGLKSTSRPIVMLDSSAGSGDSFTWCAAQWGVDAAAKPVLGIYRMGSVEGEFRNRLSADDVVAQVNATAAAVKADTVIGDQFQSYFLASAFQKLNRTFLPIAWTNEGKSEAVSTLRRWFREGTVAIDPGEEAAKLRHELLMFVEKVLPSGALSFGARRGGHDDRVALLLGAAMAERLGALSGSPIYGATQSGSVTDCNGNRFTGSDSANRMNIVTLDKTLRAQFGDPIPF